MSCPCEAAEAGASSLATPKRMLLGVLALLLISAVVVGVVLKLQSPQVPSGRVKGRRDVLGSFCFSLSRGGLEKPDLFP